MLNAFSKLNNAFLLQQIKKQASYYYGAVYNDAFLGLDCNILSQSDISKIISDADMLCNGYYQIFNYPIYHLENWLIDPISNRRISPSFSCDFIRTSNLVGKTDVKNYWEQSHLHPILTLSEAYLFTNNEKYAIKAIAIIEDFIENNPCGTTINWKCCMDVGIRVVNIVQALYLLRTSSIYDERKHKIAVSIAEHMLYISLHYENHGNNLNNHYLSDLAGVIISGIYLTQNYEKNTQVSIVLNEAIISFKNEIKLQINDDGSDYENSTYYHCFVTELLCGVISIMSINGYSLESDLIIKKDKMLSICEWLGAFNNCMPIIGDQDGSRLFHYAGCFDIDRCDFSYLTRLYSYNKKTDFQAIKSGIVKLSVGKISVFVKCGAIGTGGRGVHDHNDQLSIVVNYDNLPILIDPGSYIYTKEPESRKLFRSTSMHNSIYFDNYEQNDINSSLFSITNGSSGKVLYCSNNSFLGAFVYDSGIEHIRRINVFDNRIEIEDEINGDFANAHLHFVLPDYVKVDSFQSERLFCSSNDCGFNLILQNEVDLKHGDYSPSYGILRNGFYVDSIATSSNTTIVEFDLN